MCGFAAAAASASASGDQVFVDPDSPSGREYELPVDSARQQGATKPAPAGRAAPAPLFGEGVERDGAGTTAGRRNGTTRDARDTRSGGVGSAGSQPAGAPTEAQAAAPAGTGGLAIVIGAGAAVVLAGGLSGLWLRRRAAR